MNPLKMLEFQKEWGQFQYRHPKFPLFMQAVSQNALVEGSIIEIKVTTPDGTDYTSNLRLTPEDIELMKRGNAL